MLYIKRFLNKKDHSFKIESYFIACLDENFKSFATIQ